MYIYIYIIIYILIYILIKEAIAFFAFFAFLLFAKNWFTVIYIVWSHTGNFFLFKVKKLSEGVKPHGHFFLIKINCQGRPAPRTGYEPYGRFFNKVIRINSQRVRSRTGIFFKGYKNSYLCGCEASTSRTGDFSFKNKKIIVRGYEPYGHFLSFWG